MRILVVEDDAKITAALRDDLEAQGYQVTAHGTAEDGLTAFLGDPFDLVVLDLTLPGRDGLDLLTSLRAKGHATPILVLTARDTVEDRVRGLDCGADDYLVKPFALPELAARIRALLRRAAAAADEEVLLRLGDLEVDVAAATAHRNGEPIHLSTRELQLLAYLLRHRGQVVSREMLVRDIWQVEHRTTPLDNVIEAQIARLRRKVDDRFAVKLIHTVRGLGYVATDDPK